MPILNFHDETFHCDRAQKGKDFIRLLDNSGNALFFADGISDFSEYKLSDGTWESPYALMAPTVGAIATSANGIITLVVAQTVKIETGLQINFTAPCDCSVTQYLQIDGENYTVVDALCNCVTGKAQGGVWRSGAKVSVVLDVDDKNAFLLNGGTLLPMTEAKIREICK